MFDAPMARFELYVNGRKLKPRRFTRLDALVCNAGILPIASVSMARAVKEFLKDPAGVVTKGAGIVQKVGDMTKDGHYGETFAANLLGHFGLLRELEDLLATTAEKLSKEVESSVMGSRVIWLSSTTADQEYFDTNDIQCLRG
jgi:17beta-estradiol 17-dehydrogenase/3beta-hydroxysteroid 3-dehydrogenase